MFTSFRIYATSDSCPVRAQEFRCAGIITPWTTRRLRSFFNLTGIFNEAQMFALGGTFEMHISAYRMQWRDKWPRAAANQKVQLSTSRLMPGQTSMALANVHPNNRTTAGGEMNCRECGNELLAEAYSAFIAMVSIATTSRARVARRRSRRVLSHRPDTRLISPHRSRAPSKRSQAISDKRLSRIPD